MSVLLMTATINSSYFGNISTKIADTKERKRQYEDALTKYIMYSNFDKIIFADNSNEQLDESFFCEMAERYKKKIEFLHLPGNMDLMKTQGKSYGEAALILDAFRNSKLLVGESAIYKVTGRIWINNINKIINDRVENCFIAHNFKAWVLTSFFKITSKDFWKSLSSAPELCNDNSEDSFWCIEHVYYELLRKTIYPVQKFKVYPDMRGKNGGSGGMYTKTKKQLFIRSIITILNINKYNPNKQFYYPFFLWMEKVRHIKILR